MGEAAARFAAAPTATAATGEGPAGAAPGAPAGQRLAPVIPIGARPAARIPRRLLWGRRAAALAVLVGLAVGLVLLTGGAGAEAGLEDRVAGHAVVEPGDTLWELAVEHSPDGVDPRAYLDRIVALNGFRSAAVPAWTVVLLPR